MRHKNKTKNNGFTLLETIIYIALFGIIMSGAVVTTYQLLESGRHNQIAIFTQEEGMFLSRKITWALTGATEVSVNAAKNVLIITRPDLSSESPLVLEATTSTMTLKRTGGTASILSGDRFLIADVVFTKTPALGEVPVSIETKFSVNGKLFIFKTYLRQ
jgi:prepilin-type N-terminal cleavage/methylation domain-containing protein